MVKLCYSNYTQLISKLVSHNKITPFKMSEQHIFLFQYTILL